MMLQCELHRTTRDTDSNEIITQLSFPDFGGQCGLYTLKSEDLALFPNVGSEAVLGLCKVKRVS